MTNAEIGKKIKYARELQNATLQDVADKIGVTKSTVQRYESGKIEKIKIPVLEAIAKALSVNPAWVVGKSEEMELPARPIPKILIYYNSLNQIGKNEAAKRVEELTHINKYVVSFPDHLAPNAAHSDDYNAASEELKQLEEDILDDENF